MPAIALATFARLPELAFDEHPLIDALAAHGVRAVPAVWDDVVVKPIISASAHETWRVSIDEARRDALLHDERLHALIDQPGVMVQPFVPEIESESEWSLLFFGGVFSHAVINRAAAERFAAAVVRISLRD